MVPPSVVVGVPTPPLGYTPPLPGPMAVLPAASAACEDSALQRVPCVRRGPEQKCPFCQRGPPPPLQPPESARNSSKYHFSCPFCAGKGHLLGYSADFIPNPFVLAERVPLPGPDFQHPGTSTFCSRRLKAPWTFTPVLPGGESDVFRQAGALFARMPLFPR